MIYREVTAIVTATWLALYLCKGVCPCGKLAVTCAVYMVMSAVVTYCIYKATSLTIQMITERYLSYDDEPPEEF